VLKFPCRCCNALLQVPASAIGQKVVCPKCRAAFKVPDPRPTEVYRPPGQETELERAAVPQILGQKSPPVRRRVSAVPPTVQPAAAAPPVPDPLPPFASPSSMVPRLPRSVLLAGLAVLVLGSGGIALAVLRPWEGPAARTGSAEPLGTAAPARPVAPAAAQPRDRTPAAEDARVAILAHPFWRVKVSAADLDKLVGTVCDRRRQDFVWVDDHCKVEATEGRTARDVFNAGVALRPDGVGQRNFYVDMERWSRRPTAEEVLSELRSLLDHADFAEPKE
jgi:hypothetical protein